jgi:hypothetical protein
LLIPVGTEVPPAVATATTYLVSDEKAEAKPAPKQRMNPMRAVRAMGAVTTIDSCVDHSDSCSEASDESEDKKDSKCTSEFVSDDVSVDSENEEEDEVGDKRLKIPVTTIG